MRLLWTQLSAPPHTVHVRWKLFLDHVDNAAPRAPRRWTTARPRKGTTWSWGRRGSGCTRGEEYEGSLVRLRCRHRRITGGVGQWVSGGMAWPAVGVVGGGEASMGGWSRWHDQRCFGRLEQEDQRFKKHDGRWMDIVRSLQLESFILTKLTKPLVRQLSRPTGQLPKRCAPDVRGRNHFLGG